MADLSTTLLPQEKMALADCEKVIERGLNTFFEVGDALNKIKLHHYYRAEYATFDEYCRERWGIGKAWANRTIQGAKVIEGLASPDRPVLPTSAAQTRHLAPLPAETREDAWDRAVEAAGGAQPSGRQVRSVVVDFRSALPSAEDYPDGRSIATVGDLPPGVTVPEEWPPEKVEAMRLALATVTKGDVVAVPTAQQPSASSLGWMEQMEAALESIQDGGLVYGVAGVRCVSGCKPVAGKTWTHEDECLLGTTLGMLKEMGEPKL